MATLAECKSLKQEQDVGANVEEIVGPMLNSRL